MVLGIVPLLMFGCSKKGAIREGSSPARAEEAFFFVAAVKGEPLCVVVDMRKRRTSEPFSSARTRWRLDAWLVMPGASKYLWTQRGKTDRQPAAPLTCTDDKMLFSTDNDQFVFYFPSSAGELLLVTDPVFADRTMRRGEEQVRYGRMDGELYWNDRKIEGTVLYMRREGPAGSSGERYGAIELSAGSRFFLLWSPRGEFLFLEKEGAVGAQGEVRFAALQDRRGRWEESSKAILNEPAGAFSPSCGEQEPCRFQLRVPPWDLEGQFESLSATGISGGETASEHGDTGGGVSPKNSLWSMMKQIPSEREDSPLSFQLLQGSLKVGRQTGAVYGLGVLKRP